MLLQVESLQAPAAPAVPAAATDAAKAAVAGAVNDAVAKALKDVGNVFGDGNSTNGTCLTTVLNSVLESSKEYVAGYPVTVDALTIVTLAASGFLLLFGASLVTQSIALMGLLGGFYAFFEFSQIYINSCNIPTYGGVLAGLMLAGSLVALVDAVFFIAGAAVGGVGMYLGEQTILAYVPAQYSAVLTQYWWVVIITAALAGGFLLQKHEMDIFALATCIVGAPGFIMSLESLLLTHFQYQMTDTMVALSIPAVFMIGLMVQLGPKKS